MSTSAKSTASRMSFLSQNRKSSISIRSGDSGSTTKNTFGTIYAASCAKFKTRPGPFIKINNMLNSVEIYGDRMKVDDWQAALGALSADTNTCHLGIRNRRYTESLATNYDTLSSVVDVPKHVPASCTLYVVREIAATVHDMLANTCSELVYLELENVLLDEREVEVLAAGVSANRTLQHLSLARCRVGDRAALTLCRVLRDKPNLLTLDLTGCSLTDASAAGVTDVVKRQQLRRHEECWAHSLRSRTADPDLMHGLRRLTLNDNAALGDSGLADLLEALKDDLYLKAVDAQNCGLTDRGARLVLSTLTVNDALAVLDVRKNDSVSAPVLAAVMARLYENNANKTDIEQWKWTKLCRQPVNASATSSSSMSLVR